MRSNIFNALKVSTLAVLLSVGLSYVYAYVGSLPTVQPPGGNLPAFLDIGSESQTKTGSLSVGSLGVGAAPSPYYGLTVHGASGLYSIGTSGYGIHGYGKVGVSGLSNAAVGDMGFGVLGIGTTSGVIGQGDETGVMGSSWGTSGIGVNGLGTHTGVHGQGILYGLYGRGEYGVTGNGTTADFYAQNKGIQFPDGSIQTTALSRKVCSASTAGNWRDTVIVPDTWLPANCATFAAQTGATSWGIACMGDNGIEWGNWSTPPPGNSCGWSISPTPPPPPPHPPIATPTDICPPVAAWHGDCVRID